MNTVTDMTPVRPCCRWHLAADLRADLDLEPPAIDATTAVMLLAEADGMVTAGTLPSRCETRS